MWVENGDVLFYMQRSGSLAEQNEYLKLGRIRLRLDPNPFALPGATFRQELKLRQGYVEIEGRAPGSNGQAVHAPPPKPAGFSPYGVVSNQPISTGASGSETSSTRKPA